MEKETGQRKFIVGVEKLEWSCWGEGVGSVTDTGGGLQRRGRSAVWVRVRVRVKVRSFSRTSVSG